MLSEMLRSISGLHIYPIISLLLFVAVFLLVVIKVIRLDRSYVRHMGQLPLEHDDCIDENGSIKK